MSSLLLDLSKIPTKSRKPDQPKKKKKFCIPGKRLFKSADGFKAGPGTYEERGMIIAATYGYVSVIESKETKEGKTEKIIEIQHTEDGNIYQFPVINTVVTARVLEIAVKSARCSIFCVQDNVLPNEFAATLRKEDILEVAYNRHGMWDYVRPGDIILARVLGMGDAQASYLLSIAEDELGVVNACGADGERLIPDDVRTVISRRTGQKEPRKVALVPNLNI